MKKFKKVYIEINNMCNLSCNFCPKTQRAYGKLDEKQFAHILDEVHNYTNHIYLHLMGEPTAHPQLKSFLKMSEAYGLKVNLTTNGTLLTKVKEDLISSSALRQINISLHSFEANEGNMTLKEYVGEVCDFVLEAQKRSDVISSIRLWNMDTEELKADNTLNREITQLIQEKFDLDFEIMESLKEKSGIKLKKNIYLNSAEKFEWPNMKREQLHEKAFCYGLRDQIGILVDGTVVPCCLDSEGNIPLGNIFKQSLEEIIQSDRAKHVYEGFSNRCAVEELCKRCGYVKRYSRE